MTVFPNIDWLVNFFLILINIQLFNTISLFVDALNLSAN
jgi:hypothetical protein